MGMLDNMMNRFAKRMEARAVEAERLAVQMVKDEKTIREREAQESAASTPGVGGDLVASQSAMFDALTGGSGPQDQPGAAALVDPETMAERNREFREKLKRAMIEVLNGKG